jgi:hypothetical protein
MFHTSSEDKKTNHQYCCAEETPEPCGQVSHQETPTTLAEAFDKVPVGVPDVHRQDETLCTSEYANNRKDKRANERVPGGLHESDQYHGWANQPQRRKRRFLDELRVLGVGSHDTHLDREDRNPSSHKSNQLLIVSSSGAVKLLANDASTLRPTVTPTPSHTKSDLC